MHTKKIIVTGGSGMVGKCLNDLVNNDKKWFFLSSKDCDLTDINDVDKLFNNIKPDYIIHLAANVGGLYKNLREKTSMFTDNVRINEKIFPDFKYRSLKIGIKQTIDWFVENYDNCRK